MLAALGGAYLSIGFVNSFNQNMTVGRGFIALAAVIFGNWRPWGAAAAALLFGFSSALAQRLPAYSESAAVLFQALPYVLTLIAVAGRDRPLDPARSGWPSLQEAVTAARRAPAARGLSVLVGLLSVRGAARGDRRDALVGASTSSCTPRWRSRSASLLGRSRRLARAARAVTARADARPPPRAPDRRASGRLLGMLGFLLALTAAGSVGVYALLSLVAD